MGKSGKPVLSKSEWELMLICWKLGKPTAREVHRESLTRRRRDYRTVLATLNNVAAKGFLAVEKHPGPRNIPTNRYRPTVERRAALEKRIRAFLADEMQADPEAMEIARKLLRELEVGVA